MSVKTRLDSAMYDLDHVILILEEAAEELDDSELEALTLQSALRHVTCARDDIEDLVYG